VSSVSVRLCGAWRIRTASLTSAASNSLAKSQATFIWAADTRLLRQAGHHKFDRVWNGVVAPFFGKLMTYDAEANIAFDYPGHQGR